MSITIYILIVFLNGQAVPTTEFRNLDDCNNLKNVLIKKSIPWKVEPICIALEKHT